MGKSNAKITAVRPAGSDHQVITVVDPRSAAYRLKPCTTCPWRVDAIGEFPAEAFRHPSNTAQYMAKEEFSCHESGSVKSATCAGRLLRGARYNMATRIKAMTGKVDLQSVSDDGLESFANYREMAIANGVSPDDPVPVGCRD